MAFAGEFPKIRFVTYRGRHHAAHSGYARVAEYGLHEFPESENIHAHPISSTIIRNRIMWKIANGIVSYDRESLATEIKALSRMVMDRDCIFHLLYGEHTYQYLGKFNNVRGNRIVVSFHHPPSTLSNSVKIDWHIKQVSAIICVGRSQMNYFSEFIGPERVYFSPLGVDTKFYTPPDGNFQRDHSLCLFVGRHLRDFPTLRGVVELVSLERPDIKFVAVISPDSYDRLGVHPNLSLMSNINENTLADLYRSATVLVLPLIDATANNSLLEGLSCGVPTVVTEVGSIRDYVDDKCAILVPPNDSRKMADQVLDLLDNPAQRKILSHNARKQAIKFEWKRVVQQLGPIYKSIMLT